MSNSTIVLRFRDLVTEPGGTIAEHSRVLEEQGSVWWGWWMRQHTEEPPRELFSEVLTGIDSGTRVAAWLFDTGRELLHACEIADLRVAPEGETIPSPQLEVAPAYYQRGLYPAWFRLTSIAAEGREGVPNGWRYQAFPSNPKRSQHVDLISSEVESLEELRNTDATIWVVERPDS